MEKRPASSTDLIIGGTGAQKINQMTLETYRACQEADVITGVFTEESFIAAIDQEFDADVITFNVEGKTESEPDSELYYRLIMTTLMLATADDTLVVQLSAGHPRMLDTATAMTTMFGEEWDVTIDVHPGVSEFDAISTATETDPIRGGVQQSFIVTAVNEDMRINTNMYFVGWGLAYLERVARDTMENGVDVLYEYLTQYYPPTATCYVTESAGNPFQTGGVTEIELNNLTEVRHEQRQGRALVIEPATEHDTREMYEQQLDPSHLADLQSGNVETQLEESANGKLASTAFSPRLGKFIRDVCFRPNEISDPDDTLRNILAREMSQSDTLTPEAREDIERFIRNSNNNAGQTVTHLIEQHMQKTEMTPVIDWHVSNSVTGFQDESREKSEAETTSKPAQETAESTGDNKEKPSSQEPTHESEGDMQADESAPESDSDTDSSESDEEIPYEERTDHLEGPF